MKFKFLQIVILLIPFLYFSPVKSQNVQKKSFSYYDSLTYQQYLSGDWKQVVSSGKQALTSGYDYKYLRMRIGIAYFNLTNYRMAAENFAQALTFDSYDTLAAYYFNLACPAAGRGNEIYQVKGGRRAYNIVDFAYADTGKSFIGENSDSAVLKDTTVIYQEYTKPVSSNFVSLGMSIRPGPKLTIYLGYSSLQLTDNKSFAYRTQGAIRDSVVELPDERDYYYSFPIVTAYEQHQYNTRQESSYINFTYNPIPGLKITPAFNYLHISTTTISALLYTTMKTDTAWYNKIDNSWHTFDYTASNYKVSSTDTSYTNYVLSLAVNIDFGEFNAGINGTYARLWNQKYYQLGASLTWYPFGNTNLYTHTSLTIQMEKVKTNFIYDQTVGGKIYKNGWLEGFFTLGELKNFNEKNAYFVYNQVYPIKMRFGFTYYPYIGRHIEVLLAGRFQKAGTILTTYTTTQPGAMLSYPDYNFTTFALGIKLKI